MSRAIQSKASPPRNVMVWYKNNGFGGWPANNGVWSWDDEILVGFIAGTFKDLPGQHAIDDEKPQVETLARSLDGGETWTVEKFEPAGGERAMTDSEGIDFTNANFAMRVRGNEYAISCDRGHTWKGPIPFPDFGLKGIAGRTDYIVNGKRDCIAFLSADTKYGHEGRPYCIRTTDGGKTWSFLSWIGPEYAGYAIMPSSLRVSNHRILSAVRTQDSGRGWMPVYASDDDGKTWGLLSEATTIPGGSSNPPGMIRLKDGRIVLTYGCRYPPYGIRARISNDEGQTWGDEIILRKDGGCWDLGYVRTVLRIDGKLVTLCYFNFAEDEERFIAATIWDPNYVPPMLSRGKPAGVLAVGVSEAALIVETNVNAVCRYDVRPGVAFNDMTGVFARTGGRTHSTTVRGLRPGALHAYYVKARGADGCANDEDVALSFFVPDPAKPPYVARFEATEARLVAPMVLGEQQGASRGKAVFSPVANDGRAEFIFTAPRAGDYFVWTRVLGPSYSNDSFFVSVDGMLEDIFDANGRLEAGHWRWIKLNGRGGGPPMKLDPRVFQLSEGKHTLTFRAREPLTYLDTIVITDNAYFTPDEE